MKIKVLLMILLVGSRAVYPTPVEPPPQQSALATLAASMQPGTFAELPTTGMNEAFLKAGGSFGIISGYGVSMAWDSTRKRMHFLGADHHPPQAPFRHVVLDAASSAWTFGLPAYGWENDVHAYDGTAIYGDKLYRNPSASETIEVFNLIAGDTTNPANWTKLPSSGQGHGFFNSIEIFPLRNELLLIGGDASFRTFSFTTQTWTNRTPSGGLPGLTGTWHQIVCNPVLQECLVRSVDKHWRYDAAGVLTPLPDIQPQHFTYDGSGANGGITVDPVTGEYLVWTPASAGRLIYRFNSALGTYVLNAAQLPDKKLGGNFIVGVIPEYGVTLWAGAATQGNEAGGTTVAYLYKHATGGGSTPPPVSNVGGYPMPSLADEKATYARWGWSWTAVQDPVNLTEPSPSYVVTAPDIHGETEGDDLWTYLMMYRRTGNALYLNRANAWARFFKDDFRQCAGFYGYSYCFDKDGYGLDHLYGWGLLAFYEHNGDAAALTAARAIAEDLTVLYSPATTYSCLRNGGCTYYGLRQVGRHLLFATRLAEITKEAAHSTLRNDIIYQLVRTDSTMWDSTHGTYFIGDAGTDASLGTGAYAAGARMQGTMHIGVLAEAMFKAYRATGNTVLRDRLVAMARYVALRGIDAKYQYTGSLFGIVNGQTWHDFSAKEPVLGADPVYTTSLVNLLVMGYKYTGDVTLLDKAKTFFNRGTKGIYGTLGRTAADSVVGHFIDTQFHSASGNFYLAQNKGELQYTYLLFENGGLPTVEGVAPPPPPPVNTAPAISAIPNQTVTAPATATFTATVTDDGLPSGKATYQWSGTGVTFGSPMATTTTATAPAGTYTVTLAASDGALSTTRAAQLVVNPVLPPPTGDKIAPVVLITNIATGGSFTGNLPKFTVRATDNVCVTRIELWVEGFSLPVATEDPQVTCLPDTNDLYWRTRGLVKNKIYNVTAKAIDPSGNIGSQAISVIRK